MVSPGAIQPLPQGRIAPRNNKPHHGCQNIEQPPSKIFRGPQRCTGDKSLPFFMKPSSMSPHDNLRRDACVSLHRKMSDQSVQLGRSAHCAQSNDAQRRRALLDIQSAPASWSGIARTATVISAHTRLDDPQNTLTVIFDDGFDKAFIF